LPELVPVLERYGEISLDQRQRALLLQASAATVDRLLEQHRGRTIRRPWTSVRAGSVKAEVAVRTFGEWRDVQAGSLQVDLVSHCGETTAGSYLTSLVGVDVATSWTILEAVMGKGQQRVGAAIQKGWLRLPFSLRELHADNGGEFMNRELVSWCRRHEVKLSRGRPYRKNDQSWVEQRNWTAARRIVGYQRFSSEAAHRVMAQLYRLLELEMNFFQPVQKVVGRSGTGARRTLHYDAARTPFQRVIEAGVVDAETRDRLQAQFEAINPVELRRAIDATLRRLFTLADPSQASVTIQLRQSDDLR